MIFRSERLYTRFFTMEDLDVFYRLNGDEEVVRYIRTPKSYEECRAFLEQIIQWYTDVPVNWRVAVASLDTREVVGSFAFIPVGNTDELQLGYSFLPKYWGQGFATEITIAGARYAFDMLGLDSIAAITEEPNIPSQKVLLKLGFVWDSAYDENGKRLIKYRLQKPVKTGDK